MVATSIHLYQSHCYNKPILSDNQQGVCKCTTLPVRISQQGTAEKQTNRHSQKVSSHYWMQVCSFIYRASVAVRLHQGEARHTACSGYNDSTTTPVWPIICHETKNEKD